MTLLEYVKYIDYNFCKGLEYERFVLEQLWKYYDIKEAYLWKYVPYSLLVESHIIIQDDNYNIKNKYKQKRHRNYNVLIDTGIDIICKLNNNNIILVQCKAYSNSVVSQKHLSGFYRTVMDSIMFNKNNHKKYSITGLIAHTTSISDIITNSYCYNKQIIKDIYIPFEYDDNKISSVNKLKKYKDITLFINVLFFLSNLLMFVSNYYRNIS
jgi:hypothetical protein